MSILIVEDNTISLRTVEMILQSNGLETVSAKSGKQALEKLGSREDIQLILSDLMMPDGDGYHLLEEVARNAAWKQIPVVIMTSLSDADTVRKVVSLGCKHYLVKPVREDALLPKVRLAMKDVPQSSEGALKGKFKVLEETGLDPVAFEELFDSFRAEVTECVKVLASDDPAAVADKNATKSLLALREGAAVLATGRLVALLDGLKSRGSCDWALLRSVLAATSKAADAAVEKRDRLRAKLAGAESSLGE